MMRSQPSPTRTISRRIVSRWMPVALDGADAVALDQSGDYGGLLLDLELFHGLSAVSVLLSEVVEDWGIEPHGARCKARPGDHHIPLRPASTRFACQSRRVGATFRRR